MNDVLSVAVPFMAIGIAFLAYWIGRMIRVRAHVIIPFKDPITLILLAVTLTPQWASVLGHTFIDPGDLDLIALQAAFWTGYCLGYLTETTDLMYVCVHSIMDRSSEALPLVVYSGPEGQCWQPQDFWSICKSMLFNVHNPCQIFRGRQRHVVSKQILKPMVEIDVTDMAHVEVQTFEVRRWKFTFHAERRIYTPAPSCSFAPFDWLVEGQSYKQYFENYSALEMEAAESKARLTMAEARGGAMMLSALASKDPSNVFMDEFADLLEKLMPKGTDKDMARAKRETAGGFDDE